MLDETEFLSDYGIRALSKVHEGQPYVFEHRRSTFEVATGRPNRGRTVRRQLELARADLDAGELPAHRIAAKVSSLLRRRFQDRMSDGFGQFHHHSTKWPTNCRTAWRNYF
jgi:hypothetical protein